MLGDACTGTEAERLGMINKAVPEAELEQTVSEFAQRLAKVPLEVLSLQKKSVNVALEMMNVKVAMGYSMELNALSRLTDTSKEMVRQVQESGWKQAFTTRDSERNTQDRGRED